MIKKLLVGLILAIAGIMTSFVPASLALDIPGGDTLRGTSAGTVSGADALEKTNNLGFSLFHTAKVVISALAILYIVFVGIMMVVNSSDEWSLSKQKKQLMYALVAFLFINIPGQIYNIFWSGQIPGQGGDRRKELWEVTNAPTVFSNVDTQWKNMFLNFTNWDGTVEGWVLAFVRIVIIGAAVFMFVLAGLWLMASGGNDEKRKESKKKFLYWVLALVSFAVIEGWIQVAYSGDIPHAQGIFAQLMNLAIFFAAPTAIFFLILGAYYYITSAGDEEKTKKGKSIILNTFIATIILLAAYAFLKDLADLTF